MGDDTSPSERNGSVTQTIREYKTYARTKRRAGDLETAGTYYVAAARGSLMQFRRLPDDPADPDADQPDPKSYQFGFAISDLLVGALCYRLAGSIDRCRRHCEQGDSIVSDLREERVYTSDARIGLLYEIRGDFRLIGELDDFDADYVRAANRYERVENDLGWSMEGGFEDVVQIPLELAESVGMGVDESRRTEIMYESLEERIEYKRRNYPEIIDAVVESGSWDSELL